MDYRFMGKQIKAMRIRKGLTQAQLAEQVDLSNAFISAIECGTRIASLETIVKLGDVLDVPIDWLLFNHYNEKRFEGYTTTTVQKAENLLEIALKLCKE